MHDADPWVGLLRPFIICSVDWANLFPLCWPAWFLVSACHLDFQDLQLLCFCSCPETSSLTSHSYKAHPSLWSTAYTTSSRTPLLLQLLSRAVFPEYMSHNTACEVEQAPPFFKDKSLTASSLPHSELVARNERDEKHGPCPQGAYTPRLRREADRRTSYLLVDTE